MAGLALYPFLALPEHTAGTALGALCQVPSEAMVEILDLPSRSRQNALHAYEAAGITRKSVPGERGSGAELNSRYV